MMLGLGRMKAWLPLLLLAAAAFAHPPNLDYLSDFLERGVENYPTDATTLGVAVNLEHDDGLEGRWTVNGPVADAFGTKETSRGTRRLGNPRLNEDRSPLSPETFGALLPDDVPAGGLGAPAGPPRIPRDVPFNSWQLPFTNHDEPVVVRPARWMKPARPQVAARHGDRAQRHRTQRRRNNRHEEEERVENHDYLPEERDDDSSEETSHANMVVTPAPFPPPDLQSQGHGRPRIEDNVREVFRPRLWFPFAEEPSVHMTSNGILLPPYRPEDLQVRTPRRSPKHESGRPVHEDAVGGSPASRSAQQHADSSHRHEDAQQPLRQREEQRNENTQKPAAARGALGSKTGTRRQQCPKPQYSPEPEPEPEPDVNKLNSRDPHQSDWSDRPAHQKNEMELPPRRFSAPPSAVKELRSQGIESDDGNHQPRSPMKGPYPTKDWRPARPSGYQSISKFPARGLENDLRNAWEKIASSKRHQADAIRLPPDEKWRGNFLNMEEKTRGTQERVAAGRLQQQLPVSPGEVISRSQRNPERGSSTGRMNEINSAKGGTPQSTFNQKSTGNGGERSGPASPTPPLPQPPPSKRRGASRQPAGAAGPQPFSLLPCRDACVKMAGVMHCLARRVMDISDHLKKLAVAAERLEAEVATSHPNAIASS